MNTPAVVLLWTLISGHPDAAVLKQFADSAGVPVEIAWAIAAVESGHGPHNHARGKAGEIGRFQLKRHHSAAFAAECGTAPLTDYLTNVCKGLHLLRSHFDSTGDWRLAIRRYNGRGPATLVYLQKVEREIGRMALQRLAYTTP